MRLALPALALLLAASPLAAQTRADTAAVVAAAQRVLDGINARDTSIARASLVPGTQFVSWRGDTTAVARVRVQVDSSFVRLLGDPKTPPLLERIWNPTVLIRGTMATVWAPYDFHIAGKFSHCGVDVFQLVRLAEGWKVAALSYTVEPTGCAPSPLGPPRP